MATGYTPDEWIAMRAGRAAAKAAAKADRERREATATLERLARGPPPTFGPDTFAVVDALTEKQMAWARGGQWHASKS